MNTITIEKKKFVAARKRIHKLIDEWSKEK